MREAKTLAVSEGETSISHGMSSFLPIGRLGDRLLIDLVRQWMIKNGSKEGRAPACLIRQIGSEQRAAASLDARLGPRGPPAPSVPSVGSEQLWDGIFDASIRKSEIPP